MRAAIYRCLYGGDFIQESIRSILPYVDHVFVVIADRPWGDTAGVRYRDKPIRWPYKFDDIRERVGGLNDSKITTIDDYWPTPVTQYEHIVNDLLLPKWPNLKETVYMEPDWVFKGSEATAAFDAWEQSPSWSHACTRQIELWKTASWRVPEREGRATVEFHRRTRGIVVQWNNVLEAGFVFNAGFCFSEKVMRWKHLTAMSFSQAIADCPPNALWYEAKWLTWHPEYNNRDLEPTATLEHKIPMAIPYDASLVPESLRLAIDRARSKDAIRQ